MRSQRTVKVCRVTSHMAPKKCADPCIILHFEVLRMTYKWAFINNTLTSISVELIFLEFLLQILPLLFIVPIYRTSLFVFPFIVNNIYNYLL